MWRKCCNYYRPTQKSYSKIFEDKIRFVEIILHPKLQCTKVTLHSLMRHYIHTSSSLEQSTWNAKYCSTTQEIPSLSWYLIVQLSRSQFSTRWRERPTRCNQSEVYYKIISIYFVRHYAHHQLKNIGYCRIWCSALVVIVVAVWSWDAAQMLHPSSTQQQPSLPVQKNICGSAQNCSPDDGHNYARNMFR
jgi:hypothetical protein